MERREICKELENVLVGIDRVLKTYDYLPKDLYLKIKTIIDLGSDVVSILKDAYQNADEIKKAAYKAGFESGKEDAKKEYLLAIENLVRCASDLKNREIRNINTSFEHFIKNLSRHISSKNTAFVQEYISSLIDRLNPGKIKIVVSNGVYKEIINNVSLSNGVEIVADQNMSAEQIFVEMDGSLIDAGIDRFFEEMFAR